MGVRGLWGVLSPVQTHVRLEDLSGQTLAVDLSIWVCEAQHVKLMKGVVTRPYLRNLFFRVSHLTGLGVKLVFAIEGQAPQMKLATMLQRQGSRSRGVKASSQPGHMSLARSHFKGVLKQCCALLDVLGIPYVQSDGEAEQMCAMLNREGLVDACLTDDGDAFLYGATVVYRNFTMDTKDPHVEMYRMADIERDLHLDREKLVGLGVLLGCDFCPHVGGVGRELAVRMMGELGDRSILKTFDSWATDTTLDDLDAESRRKVQHCTKCKHPGSRVSHARRSCDLCDVADGCLSGHGDTSCPCVWHRRCDESHSRRTEILVRRKALGVAGFPPHLVIDEFLKAKGSVPSQALVWRRPRLLHFQRFSCKLMKWEDEYSLAKLLPLLTLHDMRTRLAAGSSETLPLLEPHSIVKSRTRQMIPCYEVNWHKMEEDIFTQSDFYTTIEIRDIFKRCFPLLVERFEADREKKKGGKSRVKKVRGEETAKTVARKSNKSVDRVSTKLDMIDLTGSAEKASGCIDADASTASGVGGTSEASGRRRPFAEIACHAFAERPTLIAGQRAARTSWSEDESPSDSEDDDAEEMLPLRERLALRRRAVRGDCVGQGIGSHPPPRGVGSHPSPQGVGSHPLSALDACAVNLSFLSLADEPVLPPVDENSAPDYESCSADCDFACAVLDQSADDVLGDVCSSPAHRPATPDLFDLSRDLQLTPTLPVGALAVQSSTPYPPDALVPITPLRRSRLLRGPLPPSPWTASDIGQFNIDTSLLNFTDDLQPRCGHDAGQRLQRRSVLWAVDSPATVNSSPLSLMDRLKLKNSALFGKSLFS